MSDSGGNEKQKEKLTPSYYEALRYIREKPGRVYYDELERILNTSSGATSVSINAQDSKSALYKFLEENENYIFNDKEKRFVYSIPGNRKALDKILQDFKQPPNRNINKWRWNEYLYCKSYNKITSPNNGKGKNDDNQLKITVTFDRGTGYRVTVVTENESDKWLFLKKEDLLRRVINKLNDVYEEFSCDDYPVFIEKIILDRVVFDEFRLSPVSNDSRKIVIGNVSMQYCVFKNDCIIDGISFDFSDTELKEISFRNTRFFESVEIRNVLFDNYSDGLITFEDARIDKNLTITHSMLNKTKLNLFQTVFGDYVSGDDAKKDTAGIAHNQTDNKIEISDVLMDPNSSLELNEMEMRNGTIEISGMKVIPRTNIFFHPVTDETDKEKCPNTELVIRDSNLEKDVSIGNVQCFELSNVVLSARILENAKGKEPRILYRSKTKGLVGTRLTSKLLIASYNSLHKIAKGNSSRFDKNKKESEKDLPFWKALQFVALKENFAKTGKYDYEDEALLLYMELKPYLDKSNCGKPGKKSLRNQLFYKALYATGKYGISPLRTILSLIIVGIIFGLAFWGIMAFGGPSIISYGGTIENSGAFLKAFVFSINQLVPFISNPEFSNPGIMAMTIVERFVGLFLIGYFSVSVVRKTRR